MSFAMNYGLSFASITAALMHTLLYNSKQILTQSRRSLSDQPDIHARLMSVYKEVPDWWYLFIFCAFINHKGQMLYILKFFAVTTFMFGVFVIERWDTELPVWAFVLSLIIRAASFVIIFPLQLTSPHQALVYIIPIGMIVALSNIQVGLNVITELIIGYALPGRPIAMMVFKTWGNITTYQAIWFTSNFKLGHYMKIPHRPLFFGQIIGTIVAGTVQLGVQTWMFSHIEDICSPHQKDSFTCPHTTVFGTASILVGHCPCFALFSLVVNIWS
jgi:OPT family oligopeptide transporter